MIFPQMCTQSVDKKVEGQSVDSADQRKDMSQSQIEGLPESQLAIHNQTASTAQECSEQALSTDESTSVDKPTLTDAFEDISSTSPVKRDESAQTHSKKPSLTRQILSLAIPTLGATIAQPLSSRSTPQWLVTSAPKKSPACHLP